MSGGQVGAWGWCSVDQVDIIPASQNMKHVCQVGGKFPQSRLASPSRGL